MRLAKIIAFIGVVAMGIALINAFTQGDFAAEGRQITSMPWGIVSLVDLYVGFALFAIWIVYRESVLWQAVIWVILLMILGFFIGALYTLLALFASKGDWTRFWQGHRSPT